MGYHRTTGPSRYVGVVFRIRLGPSLPVVFSEEGIESRAVWPTYELSLARTVLLS